MSREITFYSAWYCPFAQRTWAVLEHLGLPYVYVETDPYHKTEQWLSVSRNTGQVPVLSVSITGQPGALIPGSLQGMEYLNDLVGNRSGLFPYEPVQRAEARFWLDYLNAQVIPYFYRVLKADPKSAAGDAAKATMLAGLENFIPAMSEIGPYFFGEEPGIVDFAFAPFAYRIELLLAHYKDIHLPQSGAIWPRFWTWLRMMQALPAFVATMPNASTFGTRLVEFYHPYSLGGGQEDVTEAA